MLSRYTTTRCYSHAALKTKQQSHQSHFSNTCIREKLRELLRQTAQPVAVITSFMPTTPPNSNTIIYHGATLSSFTSIAMDPFPLITFALRLPSRMANSLNDAVTTTPSKDSPTPSAHMVINILASTQAKHAHIFSRPDLYPKPFSNPEIPYSLTEEGLPVFDGSLGAMTCTLVGRGLPLHDLDFLAQNARSGSESNERREGGGEGRHPIPLPEGAVASELFIAQVTRIESLGWGNDTQVENTVSPILPLLYHKKRFTSCNPTESVS